MSSPIQSTPTDVTGAGLDFNYAVWTQHTRVDLCNVPWSNDYRDIVKFDNQAALDTYIDKQATTNIRLDDLSYSPVNRPIRINVPFNVAYRYNYLRATNPVMPVPGNDVKRSYYYFILDVAYVSPNTTQLIIQLDVWQSFGYDITFGKSYVERGHIGIAETNDLVNSGREFLTVPEGLDTGSEYVTRYTYENTIAKTNNCAVMIMATADLLASGGTVDDPHLVTGDGGSIEGTPQGAKFYYAATVQKYRDWLSANKEKPWITQSVISVMIVPKLDRYGIDVPAPNPPSNYLTDLGSIPALAFLDHTVMSDFRHNSTLTNKIPRRYRHLHKFLTSPYMMIELTNYTGAPLMLKPEMFETDLAYTEMMSIVPPSIRLMLAPLNYNKGAGSNSIGVYDGGDFMDTATGITNFPTFSITNNSYIAYLASNAHSIQFSYNSADWSQQKALQGNQLSANQASAAIDLSYQQTAIANNQSAQSTAQANTVAGQRAVMGGVNAAAGLGVSALGGPVGLAAGGSAALSGLNTMADYAISTNNNTAINTINTNARNQSQSASASNAAYIRDSNKAYADSVAQGDYANTISGIQAKVQDTRLTQPAVSGQVGGDAFNLTKFGWITHVKFKTIQPGAMVNVGEFWLRYGYAIQRWITLPASLQVMEKFTYWKLRESYIRSSRCPETFKSTIRGIFEKGVTVWDKPEYIGTTDIGDNAPIVKSYMEVYN